jgi:phosphoadenosine phosphosulfate reductase
MKFTNKIIDNSAKDLSGNNAEKFMDIGGWKTRLSGRELKFSEDERFGFEEKKDKLIFNVIKLNEVWKEWYKTIGRMQEMGNDEYILEYAGIERRCKVEYGDSQDLIIVENYEKTKNVIEFVYYFKSILAKSQYCIQCGTCEAECPYRNISMIGEKVSISDKCVKCHECLKILSGCLYYNSIRGSKVMKKLTGINKYLSVGIDANWIKEFVKDNSVEPGNRKTDVMFAFLSDAELVKKKQITQAGEIVFRYDLDDELPWAIMLCNLAYTSQYGWYIKNIPFLDTVTQDAVGFRLKQEDVSDKAIGEFWNGFKVILDTTKPLNSIGFGIPEIEEKMTKTGDVKKKMLSLYRTSWANPDERVILYSLYKFAEACGGRRQFTLTELLDESIERDGVSPTQIFGLDREMMEKILNGLTFNYPDLIEARFTLGLDNITLKSDMSSADILNELF